MNKRPPDEVGERNLAIPGALEVIVDDDPVVNEQLCRDGAHTRCGRHRQALIHIGSERFRHAAEGGDVVFALIVRVGGGAIFRQVGGPRLARRSGGGASFTSGGCRRGTRVCGGLGCCGVPRARAWCRGGGCARAWCCARVWCCGGGWGGGGKGKGGEPERGGNPASVP